MSHGPSERWLDAQHPHDPVRSRAQIEGLLQLLGEPPKRVLDLGCGEGRVLVPIARRGHRVTGIDRSAPMLQRCAEALEEKREAVSLVAADFTQEWPALETPFDMVCCLGNTFMTVADVDVAVDVLARSAAALAAGGVVALDDMPQDLWPQLTGGDWQSGISDDGRAQLVWSDDDSLLALRFGDEVDPERWSFGPSDTPVRLWTMGALRLAARCAGLSAPRRDAGAGLLLMATVTGDRPGGFVHLA